MSYAVLAVLAVLGVWFFTRTGVLFTLDVKKGKVTVTRGRPPAGFVTEVTRIVAGVERATIHAKKHEDRARLHFSGLDAGREQRLRNMFALYPASQLRQKPAIGKPTPATLFSVAWLASLLDRYR